MPGLSQTEFLERVNRATKNSVPPHNHPINLPERDFGRISETGSAAVERFVTEALAAGMSVHRCNDSQEVAAALGQVVSGTKAKDALCWIDGDFAGFTAEDLGQHTGIDTTAWSSLSPDMAKEKSFEMALGITTVQYAVAEIGALVVIASPERGRSVSLLGSTHIALVRASQIVPDLFDLFRILKSDYPERMPSCINLITGPSKTADIELNLVIGVHGPSSVHVLLLHDLS